MSSEFTLDGKKYISSKRLSRITGYTHDYLSRLCREDKVEGHLIGRSWFINADSLENYKKTLKDKSDENGKYNANPLIAPLQKEARRSEQEEAGEKALSRDELWDALFEKQEKERDVVQTIYSENVEEPGENKVVMKRNPQQRQKIYKIQRRRMEPRLFSFGSFATALIFSFILFALFVVLVKNGSIVFSPFSFLEDTIIIENK